MYNVTVVSWISNEATDRHAGGGATEVENIVEVCIYVTGSLYAQIGSLHGPIYIQRTAWTPSKSGRILWSYVPPHASPHLDGRHLLLLHEGDLALPHPEPLLLLQHLLRAVPRVVADHDGQGELSPVAVADIPGQER